MEKYYAVGTFVCLVVLAVLIVIKSKQKYYQGPKGFHRHRCKCKYIWEHSDSCYGDMSVHVCPNCGKEETLQYWGPKAPTKLKKNA